MDNKNTKIIKNMDNKNTKILKFYNIINVICYPKLEIRKTCKLLLKSIKKTKNFGRFYAN